MTSQATNSGQPHAEYFVRDPGGKLVAMVDTNQTEPDLYYLLDGQDRVVATVKTTGEVRRYLYVPFGQQIRTWVVLLGRCVLGCLLVLGAAGCTEAQRAASSNPTSTSTSTSTTASPGPDARTTHDNVVATRKFSKWLLHAVPMPLGAREWSRSPTSLYRHESVLIGPSDADFTRTTWWTISLSREAFGSWLHAHAPPGLRADRGSRGSVGARGVWEQDQDFHAASTTAHTEGWVNFAFMPQGDELVLRVDTFVGARFARTVLVPKDTTSVTIRRTERSLQSRPHTTVRTVTDTGAVADLVEMVNGLPGAMTSQVVASCPGSLTQQSYSMMFATPHGTYVASLPTTTCWPQLTLTRNGAKAGPPLDPGRLFTETADSYLK